jgi:homocitrate synthase NifV
MYTYANTGATCGCRVFLTFERLQFLIHSINQTHIIVFSVEEIMNIISALDKAKVKWIEAGIPAMGKQECIRLRLSEES